MPGLRAYLAEGGAIETNFHPCVKFEIPFLTSPTGTYTVGGPNRFMMSWLVMQWFRANLKFGARIGLFALTLQIILSSATSTWVISGTPLLVSPLQPRSPSPRTRCNNRSVTRTDTARSAPAIQLAGTSLLPQVPQLSVPIAVQPVEHSNFIIATSLSPRRASFQSRAPPLA
jgi:hypothetical protein